MYVATVEEGGINRAAQVLSVVPQSLSEQIAKLEREVGAALLRRLPSGVVPTRVGEEFYEGAKHLLAYEADLLARCRTGCEAVRLTIGQYPMSLDVIDVANRVATKRPDLSVELISRNGAGVQMLKDVASGMVDVTEWIGAASAEERGLVFTKIADVPVVGVVVPSNPLACKECLSLEDLAAARVGARSDGWFDSLGRSVTACGLDFKVETRAFDYQQVVGFCSNDGGVFLAKASCRPMMVGLTCLPIEGGPTCEFGVVCRDLNDPGVQDYIDAVRDYYAEAAPTALTSRL